MHKRKFAIETCVAVSYTHLDVYKRQGLIREDDDDDDDDNKLFSFRSRITLKFTIVLAS